MKRRSLGSIPHEGRVSPTIKRGKVQAQRKFAQGSNSFQYSPAKVVLKTPETVFPSIQIAQQISPESEESEFNNFSSLPTVDDFLTFLCFRETDVLPERLNYLNNPQFDNSQIDQKFTSSSDAVPNEVANCEDIERNCKSLETKSKFKKNESEFKLRSHNLNGNTIVSRVTKRSLALKHNQRLRSKTISESKVGLHVVKKRDQQSNKLISKPEKPNRPVLELNRNNSDHRTRKSNNSRPTVEKSSNPTDRVTRRSSSLNITPEKIVKNLSTNDPKEIPTHVSDRMKDKIKTLNTKTKLLNGNTSKTLSKNNSKEEKHHNSTSSRNTRSNDVKLIEHTRNASLLNTRSNETVTKRSSTRNVNLKNSKEENSTNKSTRPWRRTKEAAALYMEMLGKELFDLDEADDDDLSIDSGSKNSNANQHSKQENELSEQLRKKRFVKGCAIKSTSPVTKIPAKFSKSKSTGQSAKNAKKHNVKKPTNRRTVCSSDERNKFEPQKKLVKKNAIVSRKKSRVLCSSSEDESISEKEHGKNNKENSRSTAEAKTQSGKTQKPISTPRPTKRNLAAIEKSLITNEKRKKPVIFYLDETSDDDMPEDFLGFPSVEDRKIVELANDSSQNNANEKGSTDETLGKKTNKKPETKTESCADTENTTGMGEKADFNSSCNVKQTDVEKKSSIKTDLIKRGNRNTSCQVKEIELKNNIDTADENKGQIISDPVVTSLERSSSELQLVCQKNCDLPSKGSTKNMISSVTQKEENEKNEKTLVRSDSSSSLGIESTSKQAEGEKKIFKKSHSFSSLDINRKSEAFSPDNEKSVYAFEPDLPTTSPPFRRLKSLTPTKLTLPNSIAVQVNFADDVKVECSSTRESSVSSTGDCNDQVFYIPIPTSTVTSTLGVAVKLGTDGPNQKIIMSATLITNTQPTFTTNTATNAANKTCVVETVGSSINASKLSSTEQIINTSSSAVDKERATDVSLPVSPATKNNLKLQSVKILKLNKKKKMNMPESRNQKLKEPPVPSKKRDYEGMPPQLLVPEENNSVIPCELDILPQSTSMKIQDSQKVKKVANLTTNSQSPITTQKNSKISSRSNKSQVSSTAKSLDVGKDIIKSEFQNGLPADFSKKRRRNSSTSCNNSTDKIFVPSTAPNSSMEIDKSDNLISKPASDDKSCISTSDNAVSKMIDSCVEGISRNGIPSTLPNPEMTTQSSKDSLQPVTIMKMPKNKKKDSKGANNSDAAAAAAAACESPNIEEKKESEIDNENVEKKSILEPKPEIKKKINLEVGRVMEAPTFRPTEDEFNDPLEYIDKIRNDAEKFGLCRIIPPSNFRPECKVNDGMRFTAYNQYVHKMLHRWGPNVKEMMAIRKFLATQNIQLTQPPRIGGMEVDLPHLYQIVQQCGGLRAVMEKEKWHVVADTMKIPKLAQDRVAKLDDIYCKYLLPYDILSHEEREKLFDEVEREWTVHLENPSDEDDELFDDIDECITKGRTMALSCFYRMARNTMLMCFGNMEGEDGPSTETIENQFWKHVSDRKCHICVHSGSVDSGSEGFGFSMAKNSACRKHPWNLKVLTNNTASVLRSLGPVMGVTVPTLHFGMLYSTCCWYRDPHGLPWIEYLHTGANKIWYGVADKHSENFKKAMLKLVPRYCQDKEIWLPSDTVMVPPPLLTEHNVSLSRIVQEPGQFIVVFPKAFTSNVSTGYLLSEIVYFAHASWLDSAKQIFEDMHRSSEPPVFSLEQLLICIAQDTRPSLSVLNKILPLLIEMKNTEISSRNILGERGVMSVERLHKNKKRKSKTAAAEEEYYECEICHASLFVSMVENSQEECNYCLKHAASVLQKKSNMAKHFKLLYSYSEDELDDLIEKVKTRIETKSSKKSLTK